MFYTQENARVSELIDLIEKECDLGKVATLLAELRILMDEQTKPSSASPGRHSLIKWIVAERR